jgi:chromosome partitioning protein
MSVVIALANQKGGVGKTTCNVNLAGIMSEQGYETLILDADPQCNSTSYFLDPNLADEDTIASIYMSPITDATVRRIIRPTRISRLSIVPGGFSLSALIWDIVQDKSSGLKLKKFLEATAKHRKYDFVFIDCPPDIGIFTMGAFYAADYTIIPIQPERLAVEGVEQLMGKIHQFWQLTKKESPQVLGTITTMFHAQNRSHKEWAAKIEEICGDTLLGIIHRSSTISSASDAGHLLQEDRVNRKARPFQQHMKVARAILGKLQDAKRI